MGKRRCSVSHLPHHTPCQLLLNSPCLLSLPAVRLLLSPFERDPSWPVFTGFRCLHNAPLTLRYFWLFSSFIKPELTPTATTL